MDSLERALHRLSREETPSTTFRKTVKERMIRKLESKGLKELAHGFHPSTALRNTMRSKVLNKIALPQTARILPALKDALSLSSDDARALKMNIFSRLMPMRPVPIYDRVLKWSAATAAFLMIVRLLPLAFLAPVTQAENGVEVLATRGEVSLTVGGIPMPLDQVQLLRGPAIVQTNDGEATVLFHDDAVIRLGANTMVRIHDLTDRPHPTSGPTATLMHGTLWTVSFLPPTVAPFVVEMPSGALVSLQEGSTSLTAEKRETVTVLDRHAELTNGKNALILVAGERATVRGATDPLYAETVSQSTYDTPWVLTNLDRDAVHRKEIAERQRERRTEMAGILPTSILYPAKRLAERVDVLFTVGSDARAQKLVQQADTRFNEAVALLAEGSGEEANEQLMVYRDSLLSLASGTGDNLVKFLIQKQVTDASTAVASLTPEDERYAIKQAVYEVVASVPDAPLKSQDIEGYVLVDKLAAANRLLAQSGSTAEAAVALEEIRPYLADILGTDSPVHPVLQKEARGLLVSVATTLKSLPDSPELTDLHDEIDEFLPKEEEYEQVRTSEAELQQIVQDIVDRVFSYRMSRSRYNQLHLEMSKLVGNPDRGAILRRLYHALPENGLAIHAREEIKALESEITY